ncbi:MAG TPA: 50S ribosomal protein L21 [Candidatus Aminicenantes bacterium]|nr:50S ribosomal protein L21 [Candidatus Aminicenantes bacterium]
MFAVIKTGGKQYKVQEGDVLNVEKLNIEKEKRVTFDKVLLIEDEGKTLIGTPFVENALVRAEVIENFKDKKVLVFKKKRRKQYRRTRGHRQELTRIKIEEIIHGIKAVSKKKPAEVVKKGKEEATPEKKVPEVAKKEKVKVTPKKPVVVSEAKPKKPQSEALSTKKTAAKTAVKTNKTALKKEK